MMRIRLNLGRQPAENLRRVRIVWGGGLALLAAVLIALSATALLGWLGSRHIQAQTAVLRTQIAPLQIAALHAQAPLQSSQTQAVLARAQFFNQLIARKSVSWTRLFERLEQIQPAGVELISLRPMQRNGQNAVDLRFASATLQPAIDFVSKLETSGDFAEATVEHETEAPAKAMQAGRAASAADAEPRFQVELTVLYRPKSEKANGGKGSQGSQGSQ